MPIIKSAQKRVRTAKKATLRNIRVKRDYKNAVKELNAKISAGSKSVTKEISIAQSKIDIAVKRGLLKKNTASRKKAQLAKIAKGAGAKVVGPKTTSKPATKKKTSKTVKKSK